MRVVLDNGTSIELGDTEATPTIGITDYSRRVTDDYGVTTVVERAFSRRMSVKLALPFDGVSTLQQRLANLRASSALWVADEQIAWLSVRGFYKEFDLDHAVPPLSYCTLTVEGLAETATVADTGIDPAVAGTSTLLLLQPVTIADANLVSSTVPENDAPEWSAQTAYPMGAQVIKAATHRIYESATAGNVGNDPAGASGLWIDVGPTNRWAIFDQALGTSTTAATSVAVTINASAIQAVALLDVTAANVRVQATGYDRAVAAGAGAITFLDLPAGITRVTVTVTGSAVAIGTLLVGKLVGLGTTEASPSAGITDFSRKVVDDFGDVTIVERAWSKRMTAKALIRTDAVDVVANRIATVRAQPSLWIGQTGLDSLIVYGFFKDFSIEVGINVSMLSLSIEGLSKAAPIVPAQPSSVAWPDVTDPTGTKPTDNADVTGDNVSRDTTHVGGTPSAEIVESLGKLPDITDDLEKLVKGAVSTDDALAALARAGVDHDAAQRLLSRGGDLLAEAALRLTLDASRRAEALRDAGIIIDPASGKARLFAVEEIAARSTMLQITVDAQAGQIRSRATYSEVERSIAQAQLEGKDIDLSGLYGRVSDAETTIDALEGEIVDRATTAELNALGMTVSDVETRLDSFGDEIGVFTDVRKVRRMTDNAADAILGGLISQDRASRADRIAIAQARQELTARMDEGGAIQARALTQLGVSLDQVDARLIQESLARIAAGKVVAETIRALSVMTDDQAGTIANLEKASIDQDGGLTVVRATQRQQVALDDQTASALLTSLIAGDQADRSSRVQMVQIQNEQATELVREKISRAAERVALDARLANADASAARSTEALAEADRAVAKTVSDLSATVSDPATGLPAAHASVSKVQDAVGDLDKTTARSIEILTAKFGNLGEATVQDLIEAVVEATGKITATRTVAIDVNGNIVGTQLVGSEEGRGSFNLVNADLRMGTGRVVYNNGTFMQVQGVAFGVARDLLEWFGPTMAIDQCSRANAKIYKAIDGDAYYGGSLTAGTLKNNGSSSGLGAAEVAEIGPFGSNGRPVKYVVSWSYRTQTTRVYAATADGLRAYKATVANYNATDDGNTAFGVITVEHPASTITLTRAFSGGAFTQIDQRSFTTETQTFVGSAPSPGDGPGRGDFTTTIGGGFTVNDPVQAANDRTVRLTLARSFTSFGDAVSQRLTIVAIEE